MTSADWMVRADGELRAARDLIRLGHQEAAMSRAYYAAFYAAKAALDHLAAERSTHSAVISSFARRVVKEGGADMDAGRALNRLHDSRVRADYTLDPVSSDDASTALDRAETVVRSVQAWLSSYD